MSNQVDYNTVSERLDEYWSDQNSPGFRAALADMKQLAESGNVRACECLAELFALYGPHHDAAAAYRWYYVVYSQHEGYSMKFDDQGLNPPYYIGRLEDFRNESMVSELVTELGYKRVMEIDKEVRAWLAKTQLWDHWE